MKRPDLLVLPALLALLLANCARQATPTGGPRDEAPPEVDTLRSTRNFSTRFDQKTIELRFDEWVTLSEAATQVVVSPPLPKRPDIRLKGKTVVLELPADTALLPNTTYTINFGTAVKDLHEGNVARDLRFVFSTGDFIDSLELNGGSADAFSGDPVDNTTVMLYENLSDSIVRKERPYYFARTDKTGNFSLKNLKPGRYKVVAIEDTDQNLKWSGEGERIAFLDAPLELSDTLRGLLRLNLFKDAAKRRLFDKNTSRYGQVKLVFNAPPDSLPLLADLPGLRLRGETVKDTLLAWYDLPTDSTGSAWNLLAGPDTVAVPARNRADFLKTLRTVFADDAPAVASSNRRSRISRIEEPSPSAQAAPRTPTKTLVQSAQKPAFLPFRTPIEGLDTARWVLELDSLRLRNFQAAPDSALPRSVRWQPDAWQPGKTYRLTLLPGAVTDFFGVANTDTLQRFFSVSTEKQLAGLNLTVQALQSGTAYVVQLSSGNTPDEQRRFVAVGPEQRLEFRNLQATAYTVTLIEDRNANGRWDSGNYFEQRQPERLFVKTLEPLRANWEVEASISTTTLREPKSKKKQ
jgi:hypothetical protein